MLLLSLVINDLISLFSVDSSLKILIEISSLVNLLNQYDMTHSHIVRYSVNNHYEN